MLTFSNETNFDIDTSIFEKITELLTKKDVECIFVSNHDMQELNLRTRNIDKTTDVLSFPLDDVPFAPLGSIVVNVQMADEMSNKLGHSLCDELSLLFIHGMLHLVGYDHEVDNGEMRKKEEELINRFNLPKSLINRTEE